MKLNTLALRHLIGTFTVLSMTHLSSGASLNIANPSFESPVVSTAGAGVLGSTGWVFSATSPNDQWYTTDGVGLSTDDPDNGAEGAGSQYLTGNRLATDPDDPGSAGDPPISILTQLIDVSGDTALINAGARVRLDFYYNQWDAIITPGTNPNPANAGQLATSGDFVEVNINFFSDVAGTMPNGSIGTGPLFITAREEWVLQSLKGAVPAGTLALEITIDGNRQRGSALNAQVDNFSGSVLAVPEPASAFLGLVGVICVAIQRRKF